MKTAVLEKYIDYTVQAGMVDQDKTDLNYSPEGKIRRDWLYHQDKKEKEGIMYMQATMTDLKENNDPRKRSRKSSVYQESDQYSEA